MFKMKEMEGQLERLYQKHRGKTERNGRKLKNEIGKKSSKKNHQLQAAMHHHTMRLLLWKF